MARWNLHVVLLDFLFKFLTNQFESPRGHKDFHGVNDPADTVSAVSLSRRKYDFYRISRRIRRHMRNSFRQGIRTLGGVDWCKKQEGLQYRDTAPLIKCIGRDDH
jgi:hypothetical protein